MTTERERILELVAAGKLTPAEADGLLKRKDRSRLGAALAWVLDPIDRLGTWRALVVGLVAVAAGVALAPLGIRFDGALDMHFGAKAVAWPVALGDVAVGWPLTGLVFFAVARAFGTRSRLVDHLAVVGLSRVPVFLSGLAMGVAAALWPPPAGARLPVSTGMIVAGVALFPLVIWQFVLLYRGFRIASGLHGPRGVTAALLAILVAEVLSKLALWAVA